MARKPAVPGVDRRQQILEAALDVFAEEGFGAATTKEIAARADVTQGLIYFYFPSKDDLFFAAFAYQAKQAFAQLDFAREKESNDPPEVVLRRIITRFIDVMESPRGVSLICIMRRSEFYIGHQGKCDHPVRMQVRALAEGIFAGIRDYFEAQIARGTFRHVDAALAAQFFTNAMIMSIVRRASGDERLTHLSRDALVETIVNIFLHGLLAAESSAPPVTTRAAARATS